MRLVQMGVGSQHQRFAQHVEGGQRCMAVQLLQARQGFFVFYGAECQAELPKPPSLQQAVVHHFHVHMACVVAMRSISLSTAFCGPSSCWQKRWPSKISRPVMSMLALARAGVGCDLGHHLQRLVGGEGAHIEDFVECGVHKQAHTRRALAAPQCTKT